MKLKLPSSVPDMISNKQELSMLSSGFQETTKPPDIVRQEVTIYGDPSSQVTISGDIQGVTLSSIDSPSSSDNSKNASIFSEKLSGCLNNMAEILFPEWMPYKRIPLL